MFKFLAPVVLILLAGGFWWYTSAETSEPDQPGLEQTPLAPAAQSKPPEIANLEAPTSQVRERSTELKTAPIRPIDAAEAGQDGAPTREPVVPHSTLTVRARVIDWNDQPVIDTDLELGYEALASRSTIDAALTHYNVRSDSKGRVQVELGLPEGEPKQIAIWIEDKPRQAKGWVEPVNVIVNGRGDLGTIQIFEPREKYPTPLVEGQVLTESGKSVLVTSSAFHWNYDFEVETSGISSSRTLPSQSRDTGQVVVLPTGHYQAFGPDFWIAADIVVGSLGYMDARQNLQKLPVDGVQLILRKAHSLRGKLMVPDAGPPIEEYKIYLSQESGSSVCSPDSDGTFESQCADQTLSLTVSHNGKEPVLFLLDFPNPVHGDSGLGIIDLTNQVQVVSLALSDLQGNLLANEGVTVASEDPSFTQHAQSDNQGQLLLVLPRRTPAIQLVRHRGSPIGASKQMILWKIDPSKASRVVEFLLPAPPSKVVLP